MKFHLVTFSPWVPEAAGHVCFRKPGFIGNVNSYDQISGVAISGRRHPQFWEKKALAGAGAPGQFQDLGAEESGYFDTLSQNRLGKADAQSTMQVILVPGKKSMGLHVNHHHQVSRRSLLKPGTTLPINQDAGTVLDPRRNNDAILFQLLPVSMSPAM
jgi:hypothetical protein